jgi:hypothetical protein
MGLEPGTLGETDAGVRDSCLGSWLKDRSTQTALLSPPPSPGSL